MRQAVDGHHHFADGAGHADHINARRVNIGGGIIDDRNRARGRESLCDRPCRRHGPAEADAGNTAHAIVDLDHGGVASRRRRRATDKATAGIDAKPRGQAGGAVAHEVAVGIARLDSQTGDGGAGRASLRNGVGDDGRMIWRASGQPDTDIARTYAEALRMRRHMEVIFAARHMVEIHAIPEHRIREGLVVDKADQAGVDEFFGGVVLGHVKVVLSEILGRPELVGSARFDLVGDAAAIGVILDGIAHAPEFLTGKIIGLFGFGSERGDGHVALVAARARKIDALHPIVGTAIKVEIQAPDGKMVMVDRHLNRQANRPAGSRGGAITLQAAAGDERGFD